MTAARTAAPHVISSTPPAALSYRAGLRAPRAGSAATGVPGVIDPGGYIRTPLANPNYATQQFIAQQLAQQAYYNQALAAQNAYANGWVNNWPWSPGPAWQSGFGLWNPYNLGYYNNYWWNGTAYPYNFYAPSGFAPTPYLFDVALGAFLNPGVGYMDYLPSDYDGPISVSVAEVVPVYDFFGNVVSYRTERFYYNAYYDPNYGAYGYYDYRGSFHWLTLPYMNTWMGSYMP